MRFLILIKTKGDSLVSERLMRLVRLVRLIGTHETQGDFWGLLRLMRIIETHGDS